MKIRPISTKEFVVFLVAVFFSLMTGYKVGYESAKKETLLEKGAIQVLAPCKTPDCQFVSQQLQSDLFKFWIDNSEKDENWTDYDELLVMSTKLKEHTYTFVVCIFTQEDGKFYTKAYRISGEKVNGCAPFHGEVYTIHAKMDPDEAYALAQNIAQGVEITTQK